MTLRPLARTETFPLKQLIYYRRARVVCSMFGVQQRNFVLDIKCSLNYELPYKTNVDNIFIVNDAAKAFA